jgi:lauroyl/myristoyl acyltransferase
VHGVFWRRYLDFALVNVPFYIRPILLVFCTIFFYFFAAPARRALLSNVAVILPGGPIWRDHARAFRTLLNFAWTITDAANFKLNKAEFDYEIEGAEFLEQLGAAKGAIVLTAHIGNYDLGAALFAQKFSRELRIVRAPEPDPESSKHLRESLAETGAGAVKVAYNTEGALLSFDLLQALRRGEIVSIQGDRSYEGTASAEGRLFGKPVQIPLGPFSLAQAAEVPIFPLFIVRCGYHCYRVITRAPIVIGRSERARAEDIAAGVGAWCAVLEDVIAQHWDQWFSLVPIFPA